MRALRALVASCALSLVLVSPADATSTQDPPASGRSNHLTLLGQPAAVDASGSFGVLVAVANAPDAVRIGVDIYGQVEPGEVLGAEPDRAASATFPVVALPDVGSNGSRSAGFSIEVHPSSQPSRDPAWGYAIDEPGVYPVRIRLLDGSGERLAVMMTALIRLPEPDQRVQPTEAALLVQVHSPPPAETVTRLKRDEANGELVSQLAPVLAALARYPDLAAAISATPDTVARLAGDPSTSATLAALRAELAGPDRTLLDGSYVRISPASLVSAGLDDQLVRQRDLGRSTLTALLEAPMVGSWQVHDRVDTASLRALRRRGIFRLLVPGEATEGTGALTAPGDTPAGDGDVRIASVSNLYSVGTAAPADPVLAAHRLLARLAAVAGGETPASVVVPIVPANATPETLDIVLGALDESNAFYQATSLSDLLDGPVASPLALTSTAPSDLGAYPDELRLADTSLASYEAMVGDRRDLVDSYETTLAISAASDLDLASRRQDALSVQADLQAPFSSISIPASDKVILGADDATFPLPIESDLPYPVNVVIEFASNDRLDFPNDRIEVTLDQPRQVINVRVHARSPGDTQVRILVRTPDDRVELAQGEYTIRSTAVSGVGLLLTAGAVLFLVVWWGRHWRRNRAPNTESM